MQVQHLQIWVSTSYHKMCMFYKVGHSWARNLAIHNIPLNYNYDNWNHFVTHY